MNDNLCVPKLCACVCENVTVNRCSRVKLKNCNVMGVILRAQTYVTRDVHMKCNLADLSEKLLANRIHENAPKTF